MNVSKQFVEEIIQEARADEVGLWFILALLQDEHGITDLRTRRDMTLQCVKEILDSGLVVAANYLADGSGLQKWNLGTSKTIDRIAEEWDRLGREPNIGDIVVFVGPNAAS